MSSDGEQWWTLDEVHAYLGHQSRRSSQVWLSRHGLRATRLYRANDVRREREQ